MLEDLLQIVLQTGGPFGVVAALAIWFAYKKDQQVTALNREKQELNDRHQAKTESYLDRYHNLANELNLTMHEVARLLETEE